MRKENNPNQAMEEPGEWHSGLDGSLGIRLQNNSRDGKIDSWGGKEKEGETPSCIHRPSPHLVTLA